MARSAPDFIEHGLAPQVRLFDSRVVWYYATGNRQRGLEHRDCSQVSCSQFVAETVAIGVGIETETFLGLQAMVMVKSIVGELPYGTLPD